MQAMQGRQVIKESTSLTVLIVANSGFMRDGLRSLLTTLLDVNVIGSANGEVEGLILSNELHPEVIIVDCTLSNGKGMELILQLKSQQIRASILAIAGSLLEGKTAMEQGADGMLIRGYSEGDLRHALRKLIAPPIRTGSPKLDPGDQI